MAAARRLYSTERRCEMMTRDLPRYALLAIGLTLAALLAGAFPCRAAAPQMKHALVLHSYHKGLTWTDSVARGIEAKFKRSKMPVEIFHEFMDTKRIFTPAYLNQLVALYRTKYSGQHFDLIICSDDHAFNFLHYIYNFRHNDF